MHAPEGYLCVCVCVRERESSASSAIPPNKSFLFYDTTVEYMGPDHTAYAVLAYTSCCVHAVFKCSCSVSRAITMTEQMVERSADTLQLCTLPLDLLPMFCIVALSMVVLVFCS